jgi:membrane protease subunit (stomatin/prohibitin family)
MLGRRRRPLLRGAAMAGGAALAYHAGKRGEQRMDQEQAQAEQAPAEQAAPASTGPSQDSMETLKQLGQLHEQGVLTDEEFASQKAKVLAS